MVNGTEYDHLCQVFIDLAAATGTLFPMIRQFILEEFRKNSKEDPGSIMRGNCVASKLTKLYLRMLPKVRISADPFSSIRTKW